MAMDKRTLASLWRLILTNRWLGRFPSRRLSAEELRDSMLAVAGRLDAQLGGKATMDLNRPRRSLYIQTVRADRRNFSTLFDAADPGQCVGQRNVTTVAPQALFMLNNAFVTENAKHFAAKLLAESPADEQARIQRAYGLLFGRTPDGERGFDRQTVSRRSGQARCIRRPGVSTFTCCFARASFAMSTSLRLARSARFIAARCCVGRAAALACSPRRSCWGRLAVPSAADRATNPLAPAATQFRAASAELHLSLYARGAVADRSVRSQAGGDEVSRPAAADREAEADAFENDGLVRLSLEV